MSQIFSNVHLLRNVFVICTRWEIENLCTFSIMPKFDGMRVLKYLNLKETNKKSVTNQQRREMFELNPTNDLPLTQLFYVIAEIRTSVLSVINFLPLLVLS
jgi:hypothetical protein